MTESAKATPPSQENPYPPSVVPYPSGQFNGTPYPPGPPGTYPPFFAYPPPPDGTHTEGAQNGGPPAPYMMFPPPPGVMYYPPHTQAQAFGPPAASPAPPAASRPKRKQVKMACTNCALACKRCDETRPCERCVKYGISDSCVDGQRKERKKGIKRGPYKRKNKDGDSPSYSGDWPPGAQPPPAPATAPAGIQPVPQYPHPDGYYPVYYPPGFIQPHEGQSGPDGSPPHANGQPPMVPYYIHSGGYPPFPPYPPMYPPQGVASSGTPLQPPQQPAQGQAEQPQTINPADAARKPDDPSLPTGEQNGTATNKKRSKTTKNGESKAKKVKVAATARPEKAKEDDIPQAPAPSKPDESEAESPATTV